MNRRKQEQDDFEGCFFYPYSFICVTYAIHAICETVIPHPIDNVVFAAYIVFSFVYAVFRLVKYYKKKKKLKETVRNTKIKLLAALLHICPARDDDFTKKAKDLLLQFFPRSERQMVDRVLLLSNTDVEQPSSADFDVLVQNIDFKARRDFLCLMFKLAAVCDGIRNDEWFFMLNAMEKMRMTERNINYLKRKYAPLRTEYDDYSQYYNQEERETYASTISSLKPYLDILGLPENVSKEQLQKQYHKLALLYHPDLGKNHDRQMECQKKMAAINDAYTRVMARL